MTRQAGFTLLEVLVTMTVLSIGALAVMQFTSQTQDTIAETRHMETMCRLASTTIIDLERDGFTSSLSKTGEFEDYPGYEWNAEAHPVEDGGWYRLELVVRKKDSGQSVTVERLFRELL